MIKEYTLHLHEILGISALVSSFYRCFECYNSQGTLGLGWDRPFAGTYLKRVLLCGTVLVWHLLAGELTRWWDTECVTTERVGQCGLDDCGSSAVASKIAAVCYHLTPSDRTPNLGYTTLIVIQSSAFLIMVSRKSLWHRLTLLMSLLDFLSTREWEEVREPCVAHKNYIFAKKWKQDLCIKVQLQGAHRRDHGPDLADNWSSEETAARHAPQQTTHDTTSTLIQQHPRNRHDRPITRAPRRNRNDRIYAQRRSENRKKATKTTNIRRSPELRQKKPCSW